MSPSGAPSGRRAPRREDVSSGDEYTDNLLENYIGQVGALAVLGRRPGDILNLSTWKNLLDDHERESLRVHLPVCETLEDEESLIHELLSGSEFYFGSPRDQVWQSILSGWTHPRTRRWRQKLNLLQRKHYVLNMREYHNRFVRRVLALKRPREIDAAEDTEKRGAATGEPMMAVATEEPWSPERIAQVMEYRKQETERYMVPEKPFIFKNPWGNSVVAPLKRGPALDGGRPRGHFLLKDERPSHVTILCLVRDAASRLPGNKGTRQEICDILRDSQYLREGATMAQLNQVVSGALDRLHYEKDACVKYELETKHWCYRHNDRDLSSFATPAWAKEGRRAAARMQKAADAVRAFADRDGSNRENGTQEEERPGESNEE